ncbi:hypothetical protein L3Q82_010897 [Scortum barcoo]|uniref:Uncharacterized protein n=1 Tax=Scortum barcoo TaxID=214431 RepID=A0ACB8W8C9_9TELE|nr:hypothetical protein L3Q82_010897 [Scortum barcoo]
MNNGHQETCVICQTPLDIQETDFGGPVVSKQRRIIHFSSGETLEEDSEEEDEQSLNRPPLRASAERTRFFRSFKNVATLVGRKSLLTCDFLGERLAGVLGLNTPRYQYAIDQYHRDHKTTSSQASEDLAAGQAETMHLSAGPDGSNYGAIGGVRCPANSQESCDEKHMDRNAEGYHNRGYQADGDCLE